MMDDWLLTNTPLLTYFAHAPNLTITYAREIGKRHSHFCSLIDSIDLQAVEHIFSSIVFIIPSRKSYGTHIISRTPFLFTTVK